MPEIVDLTESNVFAFEVSGNPKALPRMRYFRNGFYNPARNNMHAFRAAVQQILPLTVHGPIFGKGVSVTLTVKFYMKRPNSDFVHDQRMAGNLRAALPITKPIRPDIDNLAKFVLDSCNGILYHDDCQVVKLVTFKLRDNRGDCMGRTVVEVSPFFDGAG